MSKLIYIFAACIIPCWIQTASQKSSITSVIFEEYDEPEIDIKAETDRALAAINKADELIVRLHSPQKSQDHKKFQRSLSDASETIINAIISSNAVQLKRSRSQLEEMLSIH